MVNKRGWLRIVEALVSVLIVFGAVLTVSTTQQQPANGDICATIAPLLDEVAKNNTLRSEILAGKTGETEKFLAQHIKNPALDREVKICELDQFPCSHSKIGYDNVEICAEERIIGSSLEGFDPKKLKIFLFKI